MPMERITSFVRAGQTVADEEEPRAAALASLLQS